MSCFAGCCETNREHWRSIGFATKALVQGNRADQKLSRDLKAYRSMVEQGLEPCRTEGAWELQDHSADVIEGRIPSLPPQT
jgi:hypothetical protein